MALALNARAICLSMYGICGMEAWKTVLELAVGNPLVILYVAYVTGLLILIAAVKISSSSQKP